MQYSADIAAARLQAVIDAIDGATLPGQLRIYSAGYATLLASFTLARPCAAVAGRVLTFAFPVSDAAPDASGTAAIAKIVDGAGNDKVTGLTVGTSGTDIVLTSTSISTSTPITLNAGTITHT